MRKNADIEKTHAKIISENLSRIKERYINPQKPIIVVKINHE